MDHVDTVSDSVLQLVDDARVYYDEINGSQQLSLSTGTILMDLVAHCGVSREKLPLVLCLIVHMLFGKDVSDAAHTLVKSVCTYDVCMRRAAEGTKMETTRSFGTAAAVQSGDGGGLNNPLSREQPSPAVAPPAGSLHTHHDDNASAAEQPQHVHVPVLVGPALLNAHLIIDDSNKGVDLSVLPFTALYADMHVHARSLLTVTSFSKKSAAWQRLYDSVVSQVGEQGIVQFVGGTTDAFGAAQGSMLELLKKVDSVAAQSPAGKLIHTSVTCPGLKFDRARRIRVLRLILCRMHNIERVLCPTLHGVLGDQGLDNEAHTAQLLFLCYYCIRKLKAYVDVVNLISLNRDIKRWKSLARVVRRTLRKIAQQRWVSSEATCAELVSLMSVPASQALIDFASSMFVPQVWMDMKRFLVCFHSSQYSHYALTFLILSNHTTKETSQLCWRCLGFLSAPSHRISVVLAAALYPLHQRWAAFADGKARTHNSSACSTRALELAEFEYDFLHSVHRLRTDWQRELPEASAFLRAESARAVQIGFAITSTTHIDKFDKLMRENLAKGYEVAQQYFYEALLGPGLSVLHLTSPHTARHVAAVLLELLHQDGHLADRPAVPEHDPLTELFPGITVQAFRASVREKLDNVATRTDVFSAYGLSCACCMRDLLIVATNPQRQCLELDCPALQESLHYWFDALSITGTLAEQAFSVARNICKLTSAESTNVEALQHFFVVRRAALRALEDQQHEQKEQGAEEEHADGDEDEAQHELHKRRRARPGRSINGRVTYSRALLDFGALIRSHLKNVPSVRELRGQGKKVTALQSNSEDIEESMTDNRVRKKRLFGETLGEFAADNDEAKMNDMRKVPVRELTLQQKAEKLTITKLRELICMYGVIEYGMSRPVSEILHLYSAKDWPKSKLVEALVPIWERMVDFHTLILGIHSVT